MQDDILNNLKLILEINNEEVEENSELCKSELDTKNRIIEASKIFNKIKNEIEKGGVSGNNNYIVNCVRLTCKKYDVTT